MHSEDGEACRISTLSNSGSAIWMVIGIDQVHDEMIRTLDESTKAGTIDRGEQIDISPPGLERTSASAAMEAARTSHQLSSIRAGEP